MRSVQQVVVFFFALFAFALAQSDASISYDATVYVTSTIYKINTVTQSTSPTSTPVVANSTAPVPTSAIPIASSAGSNGTVVPTSRTPTGAASGSPSPFPGAGSHLSANVAVAAIVGLAAFMAL